jgi:glycosyltransferase involved in cell wall biosynthesis
MNIFEFVIVSRFFSGLHESIKSKKLNVTGIPAFVNLALKASNRYPTKWIIVCKTKKESAIINNKETKMIIDGVNFLLLPYQVFVPNFAGINSLINDIKAYRKIIKRIGESNNIPIIYSDRSNIIPASLLKIINNIPVIIRILGVYPDQKKITNDLIYQLLHPIKYAAYRTRFDYGIGSQDGSGIEFYMDKLIHKDTPKKILINGTRIAPKIVTPDTKCVKLLYVGTLSKTKGIIEVLESIKEVVKSCNNFVLKVVGKGPLLSYCKEFVEDNNLIDYVKIMGAVERSRLFKIYQESDVYISANRLGNISNTVLEAAGSGLCLIILGKDQKTNTDVFSETFWGDSVVTIDRDNINKNIENKLIELLRDPNLIEQYSTKIGFLAITKLQSWEDRVQYELDEIDRITYNYKKNEG